MSLFSCMGGQREITVLPSRLQQKECYNSQLNLKGFLGQMFFFVGMLHFFFLIFMSLEYFAYFSNLPVWLYGLSHWEVGITIVQTT